MIMILIYYLFKKKKKFTFYCLYISQYYIHGFNDIFICHIAKQFKSCIFYNNYVIDHDIYYKFAV